MFCQRPAACWGPAAMPESIRTVVSVSHTKKNVRRDGKKAQAEEKAQKITSGNFRTSVFFGTKNPRIFPSGQRHRTDNSEKPYKSLSVTRLTKDIFLCFGTRPDRARPKESTRFAFPRRPADENGGPFVGRTGTPHAYLRLRQSGGGDRLRKMRYSENAASIGGSGNREAHMKIR